MYTVYAIRCKINGKIYIGCTSDFSDRVKQHFSDLRHQQKTYRIPGKDERGPTDWQKDYNQYGVDAFESYVIETDIPADKRKRAEFEWINEYKSNDSRYGYNIKPVMSLYSNINLVPGLPPKPWETDPTE